MDTFKGMLKHWEIKSQEASEQVQYTLTMQKHDLVKIKAFAEAYGLDEATITLDLIHSAINEAEKAMPYVKSSRVIRVEEGEEIYADDGKTPAFIEAEQKLSSSV